MEFTLPDNVSPQNLQEFGREVIAQLKNPRKTEINLGLAARNANLPDDVNPHDLMSSEGFRYFMDAKGLDDDFLISALREDIQAKPGNRVKELSLAFTLRGQFQKAAHDPAAIANENVSKAMDMIDSLINPPKQNILKQQHDGSFK